MSALSTAQLAIYAVLVLPNLYILHRHGMQGVLGWGFLAAFCILRITGGGMSIKSNSPGADIISSIGISPLLLAVDGILHEARICRNPDLNKKLEWTFVTFVHLLVATGVAMVGAGAGGLVGSNPKPGDLTMVQVGMALLTACWAVLAIWALIALLGQRSKTAATHYEGSVLLYGVIAAQVFVGIRVLYGLVAECTQDRNLNPLTGSLAIRVVLSFLPEVVTTLIFLFAGMRTRNVWDYRGNEARQQPRRRVRRSRMQDGLV